MKLLTLILLVATMHATKRPIDSIEKTKNPKYYNAAFAIARGANRLVIGKERIFKFILKNPTATLVRTNLSEFEEKQLERDFKTKYGKDITRGDIPLIKFPY
jgi:hypothetical protein